MALIVKEVSSKKELDDFVMIPFDLYENDSAWVPPIIRDFKKYITGKNNFLNQAGKNIRVIAYKDGKPVGRLLVGINNDLNKQKNYKEGYISLYESIDDNDVSHELLKYAEIFLKKENIEKIKGPLSLPGGDDYRGFIIDNFKDPTLVMNSYNKEYYNKQFLDFGFEKYMDVYAFKSEFDRDVLKRYARIVPYAQKKYKFSVRKLDLKNLDKEMKDIKEVIDNAMPKEWDDFIPPNEKEIALIAKQLKPYADPDFIYIARDENEKPIAFNIALPDYNQVLKKMDGKLFPFGIFKFIRHKKEIDRLRLFVLFVVPEYRKKGVTASFYYEGVKKAIEKGYKYGEGSTVWEYNTQMKNDALGLASTPYKTYRIYTKDIS